MSGPLSSGTQADRHRIHVYDPTAFSTTTAARVAAVNPAAGAVDRWAVASAYDRIVGTGSYTLEIARANPVPEPATMALVGGGLVGAGMLRRRVSRRNQLGNAGPRGLPLRSRL